MAASSTNIIIYWRIFIVENLCVSMLWHKFICVITSFFHWLPKYNIYLSVDDGGQGLINIDSRI